MIDKNKDYLTADGREVRIYTTDGNGKWPVHGAIKCKNGVWQVRQWTVDGLIGLGRGGNELDLVEVKPRNKRTVWFNVYGGDNFPVPHKTRKSADASSIGGRIACLKIELDYEEGEGLEP